MLDKTEREGGYVYNRQDREEAREGGCAGIEPTRLRQTTASPQRERETRRHVGLGRPLFFQETERRYTHIAQQTETAERLAL